MRAPLPAGGKIELGTGYAGALAPKASPRRQLPRASRGGGGGGGLPTTANHQPSDLTPPRNSKRSKASADKAPGKREGSIGVGGQWPGRGAAPRPRPAGNPGRARPPAGHFRFQRNTRHSRLRGARLPDPRPAGPRQGLGHPPRQRLRCTRAGARPPTPALPGPWQGPALRSAMRRAARRHEGRCPDFGPAGELAGARPSGRACFSPLYRSKLPSAPARTFKPRKSNDESSERTHKLLAPEPQHRCANTDTGDSPAADDELARRAAQLAAVRLDESMPTKAGEFACECWPQPSQSQLPSATKRV